MHISLYGDKQMQKTKIVIALVAVAALTLVAVGLASAQIAANQTYTGPNQVSNDGFLGWIGNCFGYGSNQAYGNQYVPPQLPNEGSIPAPYQGGNNYGYGYGYGNGPCWTR